MNAVPIGCRALPAFGHSSPTARPSNRPATIWSGKLQRNSPGIPAPLQLTIARHYGRDAVSNPLSVSAARSDGCGAPPARHSVWQEHLEQNNATPTDGLAGRVTGPPDPS